MPNAGLCTGHCDGSKTFNISSLNGISIHRDQLECLWAAGFAPAVIPLGFAPGRLLAFADSTIFTRVAPWFYQGAFLSETRCEDAGEMSVYES